MYHKSLYSPLPQIPPQNIHDVLFNRPDQADWPDYPLHVNALTHASRSFRQFLETLRDGATAMSSDVKLGGLGVWMMRTRSRCEKRSEYISMNLLHFLIDIDIVELGLGCHSPVHALVDSLGRVRQQCLCAARRC